MNLRKMYQPGIRHNSFYESDYPLNLLERGLSPYELGIESDPLKKPMTEEEQRILFGTGTILVANQNRDPYNGNWIGIGDIKASPSPQNDSKDQKPKTRSRK